MVKYWEYGAKEKEAYADYKKEMLGKYVKNTYKKVKSRATYNIGKHPIKELVNDMDLEAMQMVYLLNDYITDCNLKLDVDMTLDEAIKSI